MQKITAKTILLHASLFAATFVTCAVSGVAWAGYEFTDLGNLSYGVTYAVLLLTFLSAHEFGHYIASRKHGVDATLPFFIPMPPAGEAMTLFGTFGAVIKTRTPIPNRKALFDIGASGPIAGFVVSFIFLIVGFLTLPGPEFIFTIHPEYLKEFGGQIPDIGLHFGDNLLYTGLKEIFSSFVPWVPPMNELYHFPLLNVGWFGLFVTAMNMLPIGQLDGGHIVYAMFGERQGIAARRFWKILLTLGIIGLIPTLYDLIPEFDGTNFGVFLDLKVLPILDQIKYRLPFVFEIWPGWLLWAFITRFFIKLDHPEIYDPEPLDPRRRAVGWFAIAILALSFSPNGIYIN